MTHSITESLRTVLDSMKCTVLLEKVILFLINIAYVYSILMNQPKKIYKFISFVRNRLDDSLNY